MSTIVKTQAEGSSPLARGGRGRGHLRRPNRRLIPAGAGRTTYRECASASAGAHPRWRGADDGRGPDADPLWGSSPLARGGPSWGAGQPVSPGLIPAGAGRTSRMSASVAVSRAHPRWRGADVSPNRTDGQGGGSSPLARGGQLPTVAELAAQGLIPAGAGRTPWSLPLVRSARAHPRWRGADTALRLADEPVAGSSPLARGGRRRDHHPPRRVRLIPAGAGRTGPTLQLGGGFGAHPRWRGADRGREVLDDAARGSSPLARGGRGGLGEDLDRAGLIPAGAGRTSG